MTSSNGNIFRVTDHLCGEFTGPGELPAQRPVTRRFDVFFFICVWTNGWVNNGQAGDLRHQHDHYDVMVMQPGPHLFTRFIIILARISNHTLNEVWDENTYPYLNFNGAPLMFGNG